MEHPAYIKIYNLIAKAERLLEASRLVNELNDPTFINAVIDIEHKIYELWPQVAHPIHTEKLRQLLGIYFNMFLPENDFEFQERMK